MEKMIEKFLEGLADFSVKLVVSILIVIIGFKVIQYIVGFIKKGRGFNKLEKSSQTFIASIITVTIYGYIIHDKYKPVNAEYYAFDYLNENKLETEIIEDSYIHSSTSKNRKLNSNKN